MAIITCDDVSKRFRIPHVRVSTLKQAFIRRMRRQTTYDELWALSQVSFSLAQGEILGVVGANGSGKSTLLAILARVIRPTSGEATVSGRVCALLELGAGFNTELTGRENVFLNGALLGMRRKEIQARYDSIVDFAELAEFMDAPLKTYSSGMKVRLAFAVAVHVDPDVYLLDEVLAVGDAHFARKSNARLNELRRSGRTIVVASHDLNAMLEMCNRALWLDHGRMMAIGPPPEVVQGYTQAALGTQANG
jgi:lipopolysaccharide transport system ATP-binding protein